MSLFSLVKTALDDTKPLVGFQAPKTAQSSAQSTPTELKKPSAIANYIKTKTLLPQAAELVKSTVQGTARSAGSVGQMISQALPGGTDEFKTPTIPIFKQVSQALFGNEPVPSLSKRVAEGELKAKEMGIPTKGPLGTNPALAASIGVIGGLTALDFTPFGGEKNVIKNIIKAKTIEEGVSIGKKLGVADNLLDDFAKEVVAIKNETRANKLLEIVKNTKTEKALGQGATKGVSELPTKEIPKVETGISPQKSIGPVSGEKSSLPPSVPVSPEESISRFTKAITEAKPIRATQEKLYSIERGKRIGAVEVVQRAQLGEQGYFQQLSKLKGELPKVEYESLRGKINQSDIDNLFNTITSSNRLSEFDKISAQQGLSKIFGQEGGRVPTRSEITLLSRIFPPETIKALLDKRPLLARIGEGVIDVLNVPRSLMASFDLSAPFRQGLYLIGKPKQFFNAFTTMFKQFGSERAFKEVQASIEAMPTFPLMRDAKLALTNIGSVLEKREERFLSNLAEKIPGVGKIVRASSRAYTGFLNKLRADVFHDFVKKSKDLGIKLEDNQLKDLATFINSATGRGSLGPLERAAPALANVFFSPRLMASRINLLNPVYYAKLDPLIRKEAIKTMLTSGSIILSILGLAKMGGAEVTADPRNADFAKIKAGATRFDVMGGLQQYLRLGSQLVSGKIVSSTTGKVMTLGEGYRPLTRLDIIERFFQGKENPMVSFITDWLQGVDFAGNPFNVTSEVANRFIPLVLQDAKDAMTEWGNVKGVALEIPAIFGVGTQTYKANTTQIRQAAESEVSLKRAKERETLMPLYQQAQELKAQGKTEEANALVSGLTDAEYETYKQIKSTEQTKKTNALKDQVYPIFVQAQKLKAEGRVDEANILVQNLTDEEYKVYQSLKKSLE